MSRNARSLLRKAALAVLAPAVLFVSGSAQANITGFGGTGVGYTLNGGATVASDVLNITDAINSQSRSAFFNTAQPLTSGGFTATFTYNDVTGGGADGIAFVVQADSRGAAALGDGGGALGFGAGSATSLTGITHSSGLELNIFNASATAYRTQGSTGSYPATGATAPVNFSAVNTPTNVTLTYDGTSTMSVNLVQGTSTVAKSYTVTPRQIADGANNLFVGFTGGTGGLNAQQQISNFSFTTTGNQVSGLLSDVTKPGDTIVTAAGAWNPPNEVEARLIDDQGNTKGLNFNKVNQGVIVTPSVGLTNVVGFVVLSANDSPERDATSFTLEGSNDGGATWTLINAGAIPVNTDRFTQYETTFANTGNYLSYRVLFPTIADAVAANSIQVAEIELLGSAVPEPASLSILALGAFGLIGRRRKA